MRLTLHRGRQPETRAQTSEIRRSYPGQRRVVDGVTEYESLHVDGIATVELDMRSELRLSGVVLDGPVDELLPASIGMPHVFWSGL